MAYTSALTDNIKEILVSQEEIDAITTRIAAEIDRDYQMPKAVCSFSAFSREAWSSWAIS